MIIINSKVYSSYFDFLSFLDTTYAKTKELKLEHGTSKIRFLGCYKDTATVGRQIFWFPKKSKLFKSDSKIGFPVTQGSAMITM